MLKAFVREKIGLFRYLANHSRLDLSLSIGSGRAHSHRTSRVDAPLLNTMLHLLKLTSFVMAIIVDQFEFRNTIYSQRLQVL
jgi:hypothetical protein